MEDQELMEEGFIVPDDYWSDSSSSLSLNLEENT